MSTAETVAGRIAHARGGLSPTRAAIGLGLLLVAGAALLAVQAPVVHDSLHNFRHAAGITCH